MTALRGFYTEMEASPLHVLPQNHVYYRERSKMRESAEVDSNVIICIDCFKWEVYIDQSLPISSMFHVTLHVI